MNKYCQNNLKSIKKLLIQITNEQYNYKSIILNSTIGQHVRHVLEFYLCLMEKPTKNFVSYDERKRDWKIESDKAYAIYTIDKINSNLLFFQEDKPVILKSNYSEDNSNNIETLHSSCKRELAYCLEHSIHHQAIIRVILNEQNILHLVDENFGFAPSTIRYNKEVSKN
ncbi:MAG: hypothetical protein OHK0036_04330 [Bacteroidia bacterium]